MCVKGKESKSVQQHGWEHTVCADDATEDFLLSGAPKVTTARRACFHASNKNNDANTDIHSVTRNAQRNPKASASTPHKNGAAA